VSNVYLTLTCLNFLKYGNACMAELLLFTSIGVLE